MTLNLKMADEATGFLDIGDNNKEMTMKEKFRKFFQRKSKKFDRISPTLDDKNTRFLDIDEFLIEIGQIGKLQILVLFVFSLLFIIPAYQALAMVFLAISPAWKCDAGSNTTQCNTTVLYDVGDDDYDKRCDIDRSSWVYSTNKKYSVVTEFDLVCENDPWSHVANSALFIGQLFGCFIIGWLSDKFGRKKFLFLSFFLEVTFALLLSFSPTIAVFIVNRIFIGLFHGGVFVTAVVMSVELVGPKYRALGGLIIWQSWTVAICFMSLQSWYIREWRKLEIIISAPYFIILMGVFVVPESVRWQRSKNKLQEAERTLRKIAKANGKQFPKNCKIMPVDDVNVNKGSYKDLFSSCGVFTKTLRLSMMWFANECVYYGLSMAAGDFGGVLHRDFVLISLCEIPANIASIYLINRVGRRIGTLIGYIVTFASMITFALLQEYDIQVLSVRIVLGMIGKVFGLLSWCATSIWSSELYPTAVRGQATGLFFIVGQTGGAVAPWIALWIKKFYLPLPFFIIATLQLLAGIAAYGLPETHGKHIRDSVDDKEELQTETTKL